MGEVVRDFVGNMVSARKGKNLFCSTYNPYSNNDSIDSLFYSLNRRDNSFDFIVTPRNRITNLDVEINPSEFNKWSIEAIEPYCVRKEDLEKVLKGKEENKMADTNKILYIYEDIEAKKIREHYKAKMNKVKEESAESKIAKKVKEFALKEIKKVFPDVDETKQEIIKVEYILTEETRKILGDLEVEQRKDLEKLDERLREIKAMLDTTETFEQKMQVLKAYEVVNNEGVMKK